jgi:5S rRNA maturation endonuclease (ribonuclease M5)
MNADQALVFFSALGVKNAEIAGEWVRASCPLAFARHRHGRDRNPSFGLHLDPEGKSGYHCFACGIKGASVDSLLAEIHYYASRGEAPSHINLAAAYQIAEDESSLEYHDIPWERASGPKDSLVPFPEWWLDSFPPASACPEAVSYLHQRGVPESLWEKLNLRFDASRGFVCFPYRDLRGRLAGMRGRSISPDAKLKHYDYRWNGISNARFVLLGEHAIDFLRPVVVVEGECDYASVYAHAYRNVVANLTASLSEPKVKTLELAVSVVCFFDDDEAGAIAAAKLADRLKLCQIVDYSPVAKYRVSAADADRYRDPGDCNRLQLRELLAPYVPLDQPLD